MPSQHGVFGGLSGFGLGPFSQHDVPLGTHDDASMFGSGPVVPPSLPPSPASNGPVGASPPES
jgi:hypothetical protein